jgi:hypothetical protein
MARLALLVLALAAAATAGTLRDSAAPLRQHGIAACCGGSAGAVLRSAAEQIGYCRCALGRLLGRRPALRLTRGAARTANVRLSASPLRSLRVLQQEQEPAGAPVLLEVRRAKAPSRKAALTCPLPAGAHAH